MLSPTLQAELDARLALCTPGDTARGTFFAGVLQTVTSMAGEAEAERLRALARERHFVDVLSYPIAHFLPMAYAAAALLAPRTGGAEAAFRELGRQGIEDFFGSPAGRMLRVLAGGDPRRVMESAPSAYRAAVSYGERTVEFPRPTRCLLRVRRDFMPPAYHAGLLARTLELLGARAVRVRAERVGVLDADYDLAWE